MESPRWRLINAHYLNVLEFPDGTKIEWEHKETARETGRTVRKLFKVPALLDPRDSADHNYPGEIIVAHAPIEDQTNVNHRDIIFEGSPTPEMEPLNEAAQAITDSMRPLWDHPIDSLPANGGMTGQEQAFMDSMMAAFAKAAQAPNQTVPREQYDELQSRLAKLEAAIAAQKPADSTPTRRV